MLPSVIVVDLDTEAIVAAAIQAADQADTTTLGETLKGPRGASTRQAAGRPSSARPS